MTIHSGTIANYAEQTEQDRLRRLPYLYLFSVLAALSWLCTVGTPLTLFAAELGISDAKIGLIVGTLPLAQISGLLVLPSVLRFGLRRVSVIAYGGRYAFLAAWLVIPLLAPGPELTFWLLLISTAMFAVTRTTAETAIYPWSQEYTPRRVRGRVGGLTAALVTPVALLGAMLVQVWLDSRTGLDRFVPVFEIGIVVGGLAALMLLGLKGGDPARHTSRRRRVANDLRAAARDRNFWLFLYSSSSQYFVSGAVALFAVLFFRDRLAVSSGVLVLATAFTAVGGAVGGLISGWLVDFIGTRRVRLALQLPQAALILTLPLLGPSMPSATVATGVFFFLFGFFCQSSIAVGSVYMLNYVPPRRKAGYMTLAYAIDGLVAGCATFCLSAFLHAFEGVKLAVPGGTIGGYEVLFAVCGLVTISSAAAFWSLRE